MREPADCPTGPGPSEVRSLAAGKGPAVVAMTPVTAGNTSVAAVDGAFLWVVLPTEVVGLASVQVVRDYSPGEEDAA